MTAPKNNDDWRFEFKQLIDYGPVEVRMILRDVLDNCTAKDNVVSTKYTEIVKSLEEFNAMLQDPSVNKITSLRQAEKSSIKN